MIWMNIVNCQHFLPCHLQRLCNILARPIARAPIATATCWNDIDNSKMYNLCIQIDIGNCAIISGHLVPVDTSIASSVYFWVSISKPFDQFSPLLQRPIRIVIALLSVVKLKCFRRQYKVTKSASASRLFKSVCPLIQLLYFSLRCVEMCMRLKLNYMYAMLCVQLLRWVLSAEENVPLVQTKQ